MSRLPMGRMVTQHKSAGFCHKTGPSSYASPPRFAARRPERGLEESLRDRLVGFVATRLGLGHASWPSAQEDVLHRRRGERDASHRKHFLDPAAEPRVGRRRRISMLWPAFMLAVAAPIGSGVSRCCAGEFPGWQAMRVVQQDGRPDIMRAADIDGDGRQELIVVNSRYSRLDMYHFDDERAGRDSASDNSDSPNRLAMAENVERRELQLEQLPQDVVVYRTEEDASVRLAVLVTHPNRVLLFKRGDEAKWEESRQVDLLDGELVTSCRSALIVGDGESPRLLVAFGEGIQQLSLTRPDRPAWIRPRVKRDLVDWWLADVNGDGNSDVIEQRGDAVRTICWMPGEAGNRFEPARVLYDRQVKDAQVLKGYPRAQLAFLDAAGQGLVRRYQHRRGEQRPMVSLRPLPISPRQGETWCGMRLGEKDAIVVADADQPRLTAFEVSSGGWDALGDYPSLSDVEALASPQVDPATLLIWVKDAAELYRCRWDGARLTYPKRRSKPEPAEDRRIVALETTGETTWWGQRVGGDVHLYRWRKGQAEREKTEFRNVGDSVEQILWLGEDRILIRDRRSRDLRVAEARQSDGQPVEAVVTTPSHLQRAEIDDFHLIDVAGTRRVCRIVDGVAQWLDDQLQPVDQIMLDGGRELADWVADSLASGWALEKGGPYLHRVEADASGVAQAVERIKVGDGSTLVRDPYLGIVMVGRDQIVQLGPGRPDELELVEAFDQRSGRVGGVRESKCHRLLMADIDLDRRDDLLLCDDRKHRLTAVIDRDGTLTALAEWPVFEDASYPYGGEAGETYVSEPRAALGMNFDGDDRPELAVLCHDRLLIYLGNEQP